MGLHPTQAIDVLEGHRAVLVGPGLGVATIRLHAVEAAAVHRHAGHQLGGGHAGAAQVGHRGFQVVVVAGPRTAQRGMVRGLLRPGAVEVVGHHEHQVQRRRGAAHGHAGHLLAGGRDRGGQRIALACLAAQGVQARTQVLHQQHVMLCIGRAAELDAVGRAVVAGVLPVDVQAVEHRVGAQPVGGLLREGRTARRAGGEMEEGVRPAPAAHRGQHLHLRVTLLQALERGRERRLVGVGCDAERRLPLAGLGVLRALTLAADQQEGIQQVGHAARRQLFDDVDAAFGQHIAADNRALGWWGLGLGQRGGQGQGGHQKRLHRLHSLVSPESGTVSTRATPRRCSWVARACMAAGLSVRPASCSTQSTSKLYWRGSPSGAPAASQWLKLMAMGWLGTLRPVCSPSRRPFT
mmetsp:Transcript_22294/g.87869  ORF Transcript_22294/g.87869 Transcript_22294/m.87869 type:complete len:408 (-) Transcript_22294:440-1663(-)